MQFIKVKLSSLQLLTGHTLPAACMHDSQW